MITFILEGHVIPDGTTVRKITGQKKYTLKHELKIFMPEGIALTFDDGSVRTVPNPIKTKDIVFLVHEGSVNGYPDTTQFACDVPDDQAHDFLDVVLGHIDDVRPSERA